MFQKMILKLFGGGLVALNLLGLHSCAFIPRQVDVDKIEGRITYPKEEFSGRYQIEFGPFVDGRASKTDTERRRVLAITSMFRRETLRLPRSIPLM